MIISDERFPSARLGERVARVIDFRPSSPKNQFRVRRLGLLNQVLDSAGVAEDVKILDIGGTPHFWRTFARYLREDKNYEIVCVNLDGNLPCGDVVAAEQKNRIRVEQRYGDARRLDSFADKSFDLAFSNSLIEHVGQWRDMVATAREIERVAKSYVVQTPNFWFLIEPHLRMPFVHWLPRNILYRLLMLTKLGFAPKAATIDEAMTFVDSTSMLDRWQMRALFPEARIISERWLLMTKSLLAVRAEDGSEALVKL